MRLLARERSQALHAAIGRLPDKTKELVRTLLSEDEPSYVEIAERLNMAVGSVGPTRLRCLQSMRNMSELAALA